MTMRIVEQLEDEDWDRLVEMLERGPTEGQKRVMKESHELVKKIKVSE